MKTDNTKSPSWSHAAWSVMVFVITSCLAACEEPSKGHILYDPQERLSSRNLECYQEARKRIKEMGKPPYGSEDYYTRNSYNLDPVTGGYRYDFWIGPHLFSFPELVGFPTGIPAGIPGIQEILMLFIPSARSVSVAENREMYGDKKIQGVAPVMRVRLTCDKARTLKGEYEQRTTPLKAARAKADTNLIFREELGLYEAEAKNMEGEYVVADEDIKLPSGGFLHIVCNERYPPQRHIRDADCFFGFVYKDGLMIDVNIPEVYLPLWRETYANLINLLDTSYREY